MQFTTVQSAATISPIYERVQDHITEKLGRAPSTYVHSSYDAVWIIGLAMLQSQSTNVDTIKAAIPGVTDHYYGAIGPTKLNEAGDLAQADYEVWGIRNSEWTLLGKYTYASDTINLSQN